MIPLVRPWTEQPDTTAIVRSDVASLYVPGIGLSDLTGGHPPINPGTQKVLPYIHGKALFVGAASQVTTGSIVRGITTGVTLVLAVKKTVGITGGDFIWGEHETSNGGYNYGMYESIFNDNLQMYVHNGSSAVSASSACATTDPVAVFVGTYGDGDNNVRIYKNGRQQASAAHSGPVRRLSTAPLRSCFWNSGGPNCYIYAAAVIPACLPAAAVGERFGSFAKMWNGLFEPRCIYVPFAAAAGTPTLTDPGWLVSGNQLTPRGNYAF